MSFNGFNVIGLDISKSTIERLKEKFPQFAHRFVFWDIRNIPFENEFFDVYFSWGVFEHFEEGIGKCIREANRVLKLGDIYFVQFHFRIFAIP